ncbi:hypothetical protein C0995_004700 [Termitomyces sp. Mi166|nr:hypothetical protein C0995_004700 [Termitomyces sp. Mi166\
MNRASSSKPEPTSHEPNIIDLAETDDDQDIRSAQITKKLDRDSTISSSVPEEEPDGFKGIQSANKKQEATPTDFPASEKYLSKRKPVPPRFRVYDGDLDEPEYVASSSQASISRQAKDGDATRALEIQVGLSSDPISESSPPPGRVKQMIEDIEKMQDIEKSQRGHFVDLRKVTNRKRGIKNSMKTKSSTSQKMKIHPQDEAMAPTWFPRLWIAKWFLGAELRENPNDCFVSWELNTLTVWEDGQKIVWFKLNDDLSSVEYSEDEPFLLKFKTKASARPSSNRDRFQMGNPRCLGEVVIWIEERENVKKTYTSFVEWFKHQRQRCMVLRGPAGHRMWDAASRGAEMATQSLHRQSTSAEMDRESVKRSAPLEHYDFSPPPVDELLRDPSRPPNTSSSSSRPREIVKKDYVAQHEDVDPRLLIQKKCCGSVDFRRATRNWQASPDEGYESVRKWTAKINIFSKKYIIVPINDDSEQHWYLAIIYQPEHILTPTNAIQEKTPPVTGVLKSVFASRPSPSPSATEISLSTSGWPSGNPTSKPPSTVISIESLASADDVIARMNEAEERSVSEGLIICDFSCPVEIETMGSEASSRAASSIENNTSDNGMTDVTVLSDSGMTPTERGSDIEVEDREGSPMVSDHTKTVPADHIMYDVDMQDVPSTSLMRTNGETTLHTDDDLEQDSASIAPANFYGMSAKAMGKQKAIPNQVVTRRGDQPGPVIERSGGVEDDREDDFVSTPEIENMTYIFTFDSLGTERMPAVERLSKYLKQEAQDKLNRSDTSDTVGFKAQTRGKGPIESRTRKNDWKYERTVDMRERFRTDIEKLSVEWKKDRAEKEEAKRKEAAEGGPSIEVIESSDDEIDIVETTTPALASGKTKKKGGRRKLPKKDPVMRLK